MKNECQNCFYYNPREHLGTNVGECVVYPPTIITSTIKGKVTPKAFYPVVAHDQPECMFFKITDEKIAEPKADKDEIDPDLLKE